MPRPSKHLPSPPRRSLGLVVLAILVVGLAVRLPLLVRVGNIWDTLFFYHWANEAARRPIGELYADPARFGVLPLNYPPAYVYVLSLLPRLHDAVSGGARWSDPAIERGLMREGLRRPYQAFASQVQAAGFASRSIGAAQLDVARQEAHWLGLESELARAAPRTYGELAAFQTRYVVEGRHLGRQHALMVLVLKLPPLLGDLALAGLMLLAGVRLAGERRAVIACAAVFFNPVLIFNSAYWGQADSVAMVPMLACLVALAARRWHWVGALLALALLTKLQTIVIAPMIIAVVLAAFREQARGESDGREPSVWSCLGRAGIGAALVTLPLVLPVALAGGLGRLAAAYTGLASQYPFLTLRAFNLWWLLTPGSAMLGFPGFGRDDAPLVLGVTPKAIGLILLAAAALLVIATVVRRRGDHEAIVVGSLALAMAFFCLPTEIHERYGYAIVPFAVLAWLVSLPRYGLVAAAASVTHLANLMLAIVVDQPLGTPGDALLRALAASPAVTGTVAVANLALLAIVARDLVRLASNAPLETAGSFSTRRGGVEKNGPRKGRS
jgi:hypothetical protein